MLFADTASDHNIALTALIVSIAVGLLALAGQITSWITLNKSQKREVTFAGEPVDKKDFERQVQANAGEHAQLFSKIGGVERGAAAAVKSYEESANASRREMHRDITAIGNDVAALKKEAELANQRAFQMDAKIDRLIERKANA